MIKSISKKTVSVFLLLIVLLSIFFTFYKPVANFPCLNADEAAFGYNAYSIIKTGKDEYGVSTPLRLKSFADNKLPLYSYLSIPFIKTFGLNEFSTRLVSNIAGILIVLAVFLLVKSLFENETIGLMASFLTALSPALYLLSRQAHEGVLASLFILLSLIFLIKFSKTKKSLWLMIGNLSAVAAAFSYHTGRFFILIYFVILLFMLKKNIRKNLITLLITFFVLAVPFIIDFKLGTGRVNNLLFYKNPGFSMRIAEYRGEHPTRLWHNKLTEGVWEITKKYFDQLSPNFIFITGDTNPRFGYPGISPVTVIEYIFLLVGFYFLFKNKEKNRALITMLFLVSPITSILTWQEASINRSQIFFFFLEIITAYGIFSLLKTVKKTPINNLLIIFVVAAYLFFAARSWDIYFFHYPKRAYVERAWQCGYKELTNYVKLNYNRFDRFVVTERYGQPYIFFLYYLGFDPITYQKQAQLSSPDEYGFGQVEKFDKFSFKFNYDPGGKKTLFVGYPDQFNNVNIDMSKVIKIKYENEEIFWLYEN